MATLVHKTKKDLVVEIIREAILSGELQPGERLLQDELADRFNVSPTPVREALRQLVAEGVLNHSPHKGVQVVEVKLQEVREIYMIRTVLEAWVTHLAIPYLNSSDIRSLHNIQSQIENNIEQGDFNALRKLNYEFHMLIYKAADMPQLYQIIQNLWTKFPWDTLHVLPGRAPRSAEEHRQIIQAIENSDIELAAQRMKEHIEDAAMALSEYLTDSSPSSEIDGGNKK